jgi:hypothetical protein
MAVILLSGCHPVKGGGRLLSGPDPGQTVLIIPDERMKHQITDFKNRLQLYVFKGNYD